MILTGVFTSGWAWSVIGAVAIVLAAMYMLRLISAVLHQRKGGAVRDEARDLRLPELGFLVPLVAGLIFLSAWPAVITDHTFGQRSGTPALGRLASAPLSRAEFERLVEELQRGCGRPGVTCGPVAFGSFRRK